MKYVQGCTLIVYTNPSIIHPLSVLCILYVAGLLLNSCSRGGGGGGEGVPWIDKALLWMTPILPPLQHFKLGIRIAQIASRRRMT